MGAGMHAVSLKVQPVPFQGLFEHTQVEFYSGKPENLHHHRRMRLENLKEQGKEDEAKAFSTSDDVLTMAKKLGKAVQAKAVAREMTLSAPIANVASNHSVASAGKCELDENKFFIDPAHNIKCNDAKQGECCYDEFDPGKKWTLFESCTYTFKFLAVKNTADCKGRPESDSNYLLCPVLYEVDAIDKNDRCGILGIVSPDDEDADGQVRFNITIPSWNDKDFQKCSRERTKCARMQSRR